MTTGSSKLVPVLAKKGSALVGCIIKLVYPGTTGVYDELVVGYLPAIRKYKICFWADTTTDVLARKGLEIVGIIEVENANIGGRAFFTKEKDGGSKPFEAFIIGQAAWSTYEFVLIYNDVMMEASIRGKNWRMIDSGEETIAGQAIVK